MIDIKKAIKEFDKYIKDFNPNDDKVKLKIEHIKRVANISREIATSLNLDEEKVRLAEVIGLFHDIGRFKQIKLYNTFSDKDSKNHAELSNEVLFTDNLIEKFDIDKKYYKIIQKAIINHNKNKIDDNLTDEEELFSKIIRDADKLDIYYTICNYDFKTIFWYDDFSSYKISDNMLNQFKNVHSIIYSDIKNNSDQIIIFYNYIYDFYFEFSKNYLKNKKYLEEYTSKIIENFKNKEVHKQVKEILEICNEYLLNN